MLHDIPLAGNVISFADVHNPSYEDPDGATEMRARSNIFDQGPNVSVDGLVQLPGQSSIMK